MRMAQENRKILIIDDEPVLLNVASAFFEQVGYEVEGVAQPEAGIEKAKEWQPHVILLDIIMPGINGLDVLQILKKMPETAHIPVFIFSNLDSQEEISKAAEMGAAGFLTKANYSLEDVQRKVEETLANRQ